MGALAKQGAQRRTMAELYRVVLGCTRYIKYDDVLTREVVESRKWDVVFINPAAGRIKLQIWKSRVLETHEYPMVTPERHKPLVKLLDQLKIRCYDGNKTPPPPKKRNPRDRQHVPKTAAQKAESVKKREEALMASAARVLEYKAKMAEKSAVSVKEEDDINEAFCLAEGEREADCW